MDKITDKQEKLKRRFERNYADYKASFLKLDKQSIFNKTSEIATVKRVLHYMTNIHGFYERDIDYLMKFSNPLKIVVDSYLVNTRTYRHDVFARVCDTQNITGDYPFMPELKAKEQVR